MKRIGCAGIILINNDMTILVKSRRGLFSFPKGKTEPGEDLLETAFREVEEETGIKGTQFDLILDLHIEEHNKKGEPIVRYYVGIMKEIVTHFTFNHKELQTVGWYNFNDIFAMNNELKDERKDILKQVLKILKTREK
jgi:8-oxo-dGTP pyrophosphatase MutT (NUDIX family)